MDLMDLFIKINVDDQASKQIKSISEQVKSGMETAAKIGNAAASMAGAAFVKLAKDSISAYADFEQLQGGIKKLFGEDSMKTVMANADEAYRTAGMSANQYLETTTSFAASLIAGLKGDTEKAAELSDMAIRDMSDNANTFGSDISTIQNAYQNFAKQNFMLLDNLRLGYGGTDAEMARLINDSGVLGDTVTVTASNIKRIPFDKIIEAIHKIQEKMGIAGSTEAEAKDTLLGSIGAVKASWSNLLTSMISDPSKVGENFDKLVESIDTAWGNLKPSLEEFSKSLDDLYEERLPVMSATTDALSVSLTGLAAGFVSLKVISGVTKLFAALKAVLAGGGVAALGLNPIALGISAIVAASAAFIKLMNDEESREAITDFWNRVADAVIGAKSEVQEFNKIVSNAINQKIEEPDISEGEKAKYEEKFGYILGVYGSQTPGNGGFAAPAGSAVGSSIVVNISGAQYSSEEELAEVVSRKLGQMMDRMGAVNGYAY